MRFKSTLPLLFLATAITYLSSCDKALEIEETAVNTTTSTLPPPGVDYIMFQDDEYPDAMFNSDDRSFYTNDVLQLLLYRDNTVQLSFYCPKPIKDVIILAKLKSLSEEVIIFELPEIKAFQRSFHRIPFTEGKKTYQTISGKNIEIDLIESISSNDIKFSAFSNDPLYLKLKEIKVERRVFFNKDYDPAKFFLMRPVHAREWITFFINFTYMLSHPHFKDAFINFHDYEGLNKQKFPLNGNGNGNDDYLTPEQIQAAYNGFLSRKDLCPAVLAIYGNVLGLGGGNLVGTRETFPVHQFTPSVGGTDVVPHEWGHHCGWKHSSNFTYGGPNGGVAEMMRRCMDYLLYTRQAPLCDAEGVSNWNNTNLYSVYKEPVYKPFPVEDNWFYRKYNISIPYEFGRDTNETYVSDAGKYFVCGCEE